ncbi:IclR family transcriptional regulator [Actinomadura algeriensis]|uniref:DNA-binding IclR family transcriptional regulator n=1 Tax=Actinomadura algeriensis TaxID=1679523 RepID=A0ABR9K064_9ACTN|nr:IclR family transcriptional regulator [Actinomadura algeriensis]MBE1536009.1 DNA-binding IclR family transcriptional regulator [Actinomadura algeriensis]
MTRSDGRGGPIRAVGGKGGNASMAEGARPVSVAGKVMAILNAFAQGEVRLNLTEICRRASLPPATGHRLVGELVAGGFLERVPDGTYRIGTRLWRIGSQAPAVTGLRELALPHMEDLYEATHDNVQLAVLRDDHVLVVERLRGTRSVPVLTQVGASLPLHTTGVGKVLLAFAPPEVQEAVLAAPLSRRTARSITDPDELRRCIEQVRRSGYALTRDEMTLGASSAGAPVRDASGQVVAALSLVSRTRSADLRRLLPPLTTAARALSRDVAVHWRGHPESFSAERKTGA